MSIAAADILIEGRVQGVGYRAFVERRAVPRGLVGYTMNLAGGGVRVHVEGDRAAIETLLVDLARGPRLAHVERTDVRWIEPTGRFTDFGVRYHEPEAR